MKLKKHEFDYEPIVGCRELHSIWCMGAMDVNKLMKRSLAIFCLAFVDCLWSTCPNRACVGEWKSEVLIPKNSAYVQGVVS